ncbi:hypothetical protein [Mycobacterium sp. E342]|uniref:hypothetical protein n=1 Tax=Mycobacterium sp. E342 TaxID=1834147 RepID=UPI000AE4EC9E|nr:hypothetical protein [Mycobacterium sp. E342]
MAALGGAPNLSALLAWPTDHLTEAAAQWQTVGEHSYAVAHQVWRDAASVDWLGEAADALRCATHADLQATSAAVDQLQAATRAARSGASDLYAARSRVRYTVEDARTAGFEVGEDLSVTDRMGSGSAAERAARQAAAQAFAGEIRQSAVQLVNVDQQVASKIAAAVAGIRDTFPQKPPTIDPLPPATAISALSIVSGNKTVATVNRIPAVPAAPAGTISVECLRNCLLAIDQTSGKCVLRKISRICGSGQNSTESKCRTGTATPAKGFDTGYLTARRSGSAGPPSPTENRLLTSTFPITAAIQKFTSTREVAYRK